MFSYSMPAPLRRTFLVLRELGARHVAKLSLTYGLTVVENICFVLYPYLTGVAIDGLIAHQWLSLLPFVMVWLIHLAVGTARYLYDTRVFTQIYSELATKTVGEQRAAGVESGRLIARVGLSRELVRFFEYEMPAIVSGLIFFVGALIMLYFSDVWIGLAATAAIAPVVIVSTWLSKRSYRLNKGLNNRLEREVEIVGARRIEAVAKHFARLRFWRIQLSNVQAFSWSWLELVAIALFAFTIIRITTIDDVTIGAIYATLSYYWNYKGSLLDLPNLLQSMARITDVTRRLKVPADDAISVDDVVQEGSR
jgi:ABC-type multidrug transport system fused ATPase/permease subunit